MRNSFFLFVILPMVLLSGCAGYKQQTAMPQGIQSIHVDTVINKVPLEEVYAYQPGVEIAVTNAVINRFHRDGNLKIAKAEESDATLRMYLVRYEQEGVRFSSLEQVEEYRLFIVLNIELEDNRTGEIIFEENDFSGDAEYFVSDVRSIAREDATTRAINRLARNVVDRIVEDW